MLFPYSGEEALSGKQSLRVLSGWMLFLPLILSLCALIPAALFSYSLQKIAMLFLFAFLSGFFIFGGLGLLVVVVNNKSAHIRQARKVTGASNTTGDRYGS
jgi:hypothetical protein